MIDFFTYISQITLQKVDDAVLDFKVAEVVLKQAMKRVTDPVKIAGWLGIIID